MHVPPAIWIDVEDIFDYFRFNPHPSGIQRVAIEIIRALIAQTQPGRVRIVRHRVDPLRPTATPELQQMRWDELEAMLATPPPPEKPRADDVPDDVARRSRIQRTILNLPPELRGSLFRAGVLQSQVLRNVRLLAAATRPQSRELRTITHGATLADRPAPGDAFLVLGAPWSVPGSAALLRRMHEAGLHTALLIHDLIPVRRPEWQTPTRVANFRAWLETSLPACKTIFAISRFTAQDVESYASQRRISLQAPVRPIAPGVTAPATPAATRPAGFPAPGRYVLYVSTLEARKNHALAVTIWHRLMAEIRAGQRPADTLPTLVFAGRIGNGVADMLQQLDNSRWLNGRIRLFRDPTDQEVRALYEGCLFTIMPSLYEGWGLPLQESLLLGKPCLAALGTALPESGGDLCRYFDPEDVTDAHRAVAALLDDLAGLAAWQTDIRTRFRPGHWHDTATAILETFYLAPVTA